MNIKEIAQEAVKLTIPEWLKVDIAGNYGLAPYYRFLYLLAKEMRPQVMVELGTREGLGALCMLKGNFNSRVVTIDIVSVLHPQCIHFAIDYLEQDSLKECDINNIGILFIDTEHNGRAALEYEAWKNKMIKGGIVLFDDINLTEEMREFWQGFNPEGQKIDLSELHASGFGAVVIEAPEA